MEELQQQDGNIQETPQEATGAEQPQEQQVETPSLSELTGGQFEDVTELWSGYQQYAETIASMPDQEEYDDYLKGIINRYKETGDLKPYFEAMSNNYDEMSAEGILRAKFRNDNPGFDEDELDYMFNQQVMSKYPIDPEKHTEREISIGQKLMEKEAEKLRASLKEEQQKYLSSNNEDDYKQQLEDFYQRVDESEAIKSIFDTGKISVKYGDNEVGYGVKDAQPLVEMIKDNGKFWQLFAKEDGQVDFEKVARVFAFASDEEGFLKAISASSKAQGTEEVLNEIKNPSIKNGQTPSFASEDKDLALLKKFAEAAKN